MKNYTSWLIATVIFMSICQIGQTQSVELSLKNRVIPTQHMVNSPTPTQPQKKQTEVKGWDEVFKNKPVEQNAFNIKVDTVYKKEEPILKSPLLNSDKKIPIFEEKPITVKFENGQIVPIGSLSDKQRQILLDTITNKPITVQQIFKKLDADDEIDSIFNRLTNFTYLGENYTIEKIPAPRVKKSKPIGQKFKVEHINISSNEEYIDMFEDQALKGELDGVPACITLAQGILESVGGRSKMARTTNNNFGIKCGGGRCTKTGCQHAYFYDDKPNETFKVYPNFEASFKDHIKFFIENDRYDKCLSCGLNNIHCWLYRLQKSGYALDASYDYKLAAIIDKYGLWDKPLNYNRKKVANSLK